ncbi:NADPH:quinone reductase, partial [Streptomyces sp. NPDC059590]
GSSVFALRVPPAPPAPPARVPPPAAAVGAHTVLVGHRYPLADIAEAHERVDAGGRGRVLVDIPR